MIPHRNITRRFERFALNSYTFSLGIRNQLIIKVKSAPDIMQPILGKNASSSAFEDLGPASVHIVHDLKNQLNGLKLYATFLRKRLERDERPLDELETVAKLMAGLDRVAIDLTAIIRHAQPRELKPQMHVDLLKILSRALDETDRAASSDELSQLSEPNNAPMYGEFDPGPLGEAIKSFIGLAKSVSGANSSQFKLSRVVDPPEALIEWRHEGPPHKEDPFGLFKGIATVRLAVAGRIIEDHGGRVEHDAQGLRIWLPLID